MIAYTKIPTVSLHFLCMDQSYRRASYQSDVKGCSEHAPLLKVCHLQVYQTSEAQIFLLSPCTAAVRASFQSHLSHFFLSICQAEQTLILSSLSKETALSWRSGEGER